MMHLADHTKQIRIGSGGIMLYIIVALRLQNG